MSRNVEEFDFDLKLEKIKKSLQNEEDVVDPENHPTLIHSGGSSVLTAAPNKPLTRPQRFKRVDSNDGSEESFTSSKAASEEPVTDSKQVASQLSRTSTNDSKGDASESRVETSIDAPSRPKTRPQRSKVSSVNDVSRETSLEPESSSELLNKQSVEDAKEVLATSDGLKNSPVSDETPLNTSSSLDNEKRMSTSQSQEPVVPPRPSSRPARKTDSTVGDSTSTQSGDLVDSDIPPRPSSRPTKVRKDENNVDSEKELEHKSKDAVSSDKELHSEPSSKDTNLDSVNEKLDSTPSKALASDLSSDTKSDILSSTLKKDADISESAKDTDKSLESQTKNTSNISSPLDIESNTQTSDVPPRPASRPRKPIKTESFDDPKQLSDDALPSRSSQKLDEDYTLPKVDSVGSIKPTVLEEFKEAQVKEINVTPDIKPITPDDLPDVRRAMKENEIVEESKIIEKAIPRDEVQTDVPKSVFKPQDEELVDPKDTSEAPVSKPKPPKPLGPKPKSALAARFEAALRENEEKPKPKPIPRGSTGRVSAIQKSMFAELNAALSRGPPGRSRLDSDGSDTSSNSRRSSEVNDTESLSVDSNETADAQLNAMPKQPRARAAGPSRRRRLPESAKPVYDFVVQQTPIWEIKPTKPSENSDKVSSGKEAVSETKSEEKESDPSKSNLDESDNSQRDVKTDPKVDSSVKSKEFASDSSKSTTKVPIESTNSSTTASEDVKDNTKEINSNDVSTGSQYTDKEPESRPHRKYISTREDIGEDTPKTPTKQTVDEDMTPQEESKLRTALSRSLGNEAYGDRDAFEPPSTRQTEKSGEKPLTQESIEEAQDHILPSLGSLIDRVDSPGNTPEVKKHHASNGQATTEELFDISADKPNQELTPTKEVLKNSGVNLKAYLDKSLDSQSPDKEKKQFIE